LRLATAYSGREICEVVWLVASEHVYNNGLHILSDMLCDLTRKREAARASLHEIKPGLPAVRMPTEQ
jgi:hypothetical protein